MLDNIYGKPFRFYANRFEEWLSGGRLVRNEKCNVEIIADIVNGNINIQLRGAHCIPIVKEFSFDLGMPLFSVLSDRIQYFSSIVNNSMVPMVCHIFDKPELYVRFAMTNPDRLIEFYGRMELFTSDKKQDNDIFPITFNSCIHARYERGNLIGGEQLCHRVVEIVKNTNGCKGYNIEPNRGYIVKIFNPEIGRAQMADKPMDIVSQTADCIEFRGYPLQAMGPFGWETVDYSEYGMKVHFIDGRILKCVLYMYDRDTYIEYIGFDF